jgi:aminoglycoside phosphotransferase (APT) family kinase protein
MAVESAVPEHVDAALRAFAGDRRIEGLRAMPGHAGFSYGFSIDGHGYVLRVPPPGVRHAGPADVVRQGRLLEALGPAGVPVPPVRGVGEEPEPWFAVDLLPGATISPTDGGPSAWDPEELPALAQQAVEALRALHDVPPPELLGDPVTPEQAVMRWERFRERAADPALLARAPELRDALLARAPAHARVGIVHGDFQWGNLLAARDDDGEPRLAAILDWELSRAGTVLDDLGWLCVFSDPKGWARSPYSPALPKPERLIAWYGADPAEVAWHRALGGYAFAVIIGLNLMLHRRGKRPDPHYEQLAPSAPTLVERALDVLATAT